VNQRDVAPSIAKLCEGLILSFFPRLLNVKLSTYPFVDKNNA
jgi:hypothetical protein